MDDSEGAFSFDFEPALDGGGIAGDPSAAMLQDLYGDPRAHMALAPDAAPADRRNFRRTVCRHWLRGLCMKGASCGFLHQYDKEKMPVCRFFRSYGECREKDCLYKHTLEEIKDCHMYCFYPLLCSILHTLWEILTYFAGTGYMMGFCPNGSSCRFRHLKLPGPPPPVEEVFKKIQHLSLFSYSSSNRNFQTRNSKSSLS
ncbi:Cleavage and polyadenylation specificity factor CPSF30 [Platanthera guangdongensis]|uniref:Cleavage and polyadenylation specificity factor CPSF30 n=1 Tax=Platanthera guangdongensis TaxID=2320717 RepID=A0ABR2MHG0_9ASPA